jgi:GNAT superfamily N-acetyltransferase
MTDAKAIQQVLLVLRIPGVPWADWHTMTVIREAIGEGRYYVAEAYGTVIGAMSVLRHRRMVEIGTLAVRRSFHGLGIGKRLVQFACFLGRRFAAKLITVSSLVAYRAKKFYLNVGFRIKSSGLYRGRKWYEFAAAL